ncbi:serum paraoxonase/arylesterase 1-like isoform X1 [Strongylocentrotus purpuratus]|uniref:Paraoxonase n=1 Tax=Strongylocentrotus purpuratus TaxID=7668 RepID=A0A7M7P4J6_STRPU|nr:serum paraoxonase/arylesterase 1-like isoform X1 [Strongylocentrotus purpuratus]
MWKFLLISFVGLVVIQHMLTFIYIMGYHKFVFKHRPGNCQVLNYIDYGVADMELMADGLVLIASSYYRSNPKIGVIHTFNLSSPNDGFTRVTISSRPQGSFHPVGLSSIHDTGSTYVYVVNQQTVRDCIEVYEWRRADKPTMKYLKEIHDPFMRRLSDVLAVGSDQFYVTNQAYSLDPGGRLFEHYMMFPWGSVLYCDPSCRLVSNAIFEPSGIHMSPDRKYIYVSLLYGMGVHGYKRDPASNILSPQTDRSVSLSSLVDNVFVDANGNVWTANHPAAFKYEAYERHRRSLPPSQVLHIRYHGASNEVFELYSDDGTQLPASSSAVFHKDKLLIASRYKGMLLCETNIKW